QIDVNLTGHFRLIQAVLPGMRAAGHGRIVIITSGWGVIGHPNATAYAASKAGLIALTKGLGRELGPQRILTNAIAPSFIDTEQLRVDADDAGITLEEMRQRYREQMRLQVHAEPLHQARRWAVASVAVADHPVPSDAAEPQREQGFGGLGGQAPPVVIRVEDESDLSLPVLPADQLEPGLAHHLPGRTPDHGERKPVALRAQRGLPALLGQGLPRLRAVTGIPVQVPATSGRDW
ncbi:MAG TPA: SDR family NAD(P)-dependent oxidoreductase, partial [Streptosporangiaceae bacterium]|nr:SDR family NAD(P)-dependent oxidoreductase [Streptosporangiaceae bacterium]